MKPLKLERVESTHVVKAIIAFTGDSNAQAGVIMPPALPTLAIDFIPVVVLSADGTAIQMRGMPLPFPGAVAVTPAGDPKPELPGVVFEQDEEDLQTWAAWVKASTQILADAPALLPFLEALLSRAVRLSVDAYVMSFLTNPAAASTGGAANIAAALAELYTTKGVIADTIALSPGAFFAIGAQDPWSVGASMFGMNVGISPSLGADEFVVGPFAGGSVLSVREAMNVSIGLVNDDFTKNLRTVLGEARGAWSSIDNDAFLRGSV